MQNPTGWIGFISGPAKTTWPGIEKCLPGGRLAGSGVRLRRVKDRVEAQGISETVHKGKPMPELSLQTAPRATSSKQRRVAEAHGSQEVEPGISMEQALQSPALRANAGRWRGGTETRRVTALLARLMNGLQSIKPSWLDGSRPGGPSLVEALPLRPSRVEAPVTSSWSGGLMRMVWQRVCMNWWRTLLLTLVILCFPKLTAMVITWVLRLAISFVKALRWRILAEAAASTTPGGGTPPPPHPFHWMSSLLLLVDIYLRVRPMVGAG